MRDPVIILSKNCHCSFLKRSLQESRGLHYWHTPQYSHILSNNQEEIGQFRRHNSRHLMGNQKMLVKGILH